MFDAILYGIGGTIGVAIGGALVLAAVHLIGLVIVWFLAWMVRDG